MTIRAAWAFILAGAAIAGCTDQNTRGDEKASSDVLASKATPLDLKAPETLSRGLWRVTAINGETLTEEGSPILLSVDGESIHAQSQCVWWQWSHAIEGPAFAAAPLSRLALDDQAGMMSQPMCARGYSVQEEAFAKALEKGYAITRPSPTTVTIKGSAGSIALEKQRGTATPITLIHRDSLAGTWRVSAVDGRPPQLVDGPFRIRFDDRHAMSSSSCIAWFWVYQGSQGQIAFSKRPLLIPICERGISPAEQGFTDRIEASRTLVRTADGSVQLQGDKGSLTLVSDK